MINRIAYLTAFVLGGLSMSTVRSAELTSDSIYDPKKILNVEITIPEADWQQLCGQNRDPRGVFAGKVEDPFTYFRGDIQIDGVAIKGVGIRKKGFIGSLDDRYPSLKIKFDEFVDQQPVVELEGLTLNNNKQDTSLVSQTLAYELFSAAGVNAPRTTFAKVSVNGHYLGIYSNVESIAKPFLKRRFKNNQGNLYEGTLADLYPHALDRMEIKTNKKKHNRARLDRLASLLSEEPNLKVEQLEELVDVENFLRYWAVESLISFWDGYTNNQNNYWMYENPDTGKFVFVPWGADAAFMASPFGGFGPSGAQSVYAESLLANRLIQMEEVATRYRDTMRWLLDNVWKEDQLIQRIDEIEALLEGHTHSRQLGSARSMQAVHQFIKRRRKIIEQELDAWPVRVPPYPRKPMYVVPVGSIEGSVVATWAARPPASLKDRGEVKLNMTMDGQALTFESAGVSVHAAPRMGFPGFGPPMPAGPPMVDMVIEGITANSEKTSRFSLSIPQATLKEATGKTLSIDGFYTPDTKAVGFGMPVGKPLSGIITFGQVNLESGMPIEATLNLKINDVRGGFMNRQRVDPSARPVTP